MEDFGPYRDEEKLLEDLKEINRRKEFDVNSMVVHVYVTNLGPLGIGRQYLGVIGAGSILMQRGIDESRLGA